MNIRKTIKITEEMGSKIEDLYLNHGIGSGRIGIILGIGGSRVSTYLKKKGLTRPPEEVHRLKSIYLRNQGRNNDDYNYEQKNRRKINAQLNADLKKRS